MLFIIENEPIMRYEAKGDEQISGQSLRKVYISMIMMIVCVSLHCIRRILLFLVHLLLRVYREGSLFKRLLFSFIDHHFPYL